MTSDRVKRSVGMWLMIAMSAVACGKVAHERSAPPTGGGGAGAGGDRESGGEPVSAGSPASVGSDDGGAAGEAGEPNQPTEEWHACGTIAAQQRVRWARFALGERAALVGYDDGAVRLQPLDEPAPGQLFEQGRADVPSAISPDGSRYAQFTHGSAGNAGGAGRVEVFTLDTLAPLSALEWPADEPCGENLKFSLDGEQVVTWGDSGNCVFDAGTGQRLLRLLAPAQFAALVGDELRLQQGDLLVSYDLSGVKLDEHLIPLPDGAHLSKLSPAADTAVIVSIQSVGLLDVATGQLRSTAIPNLNNGAVFSADGSLVMAGGLLLRTVDGKALRLGDPLPSGDVDLSASGEQALHTRVMFGTAGAAHLIDLGTGLQRRVFGEPSLTPLALAVSPDGAWLARTGLNGLSAFKLNADFASSVPAWHWPGLGDPVFGVEYSALELYGGPVLAVTGDNQDLFSTVGQPLLLPIPPASVAVGCDGAYAVFSPSGTRFAGSSFEYFVDVRDTASQRVEAHLPSASCNTSAAFSADESLLATSGPELYRTRDWSRLWPSEITKPAPVPDHDNPPLALNRVLFLPGEQQLLVSQCNGDYFGSASCSSEVYSVATGERLRSLPLSAPRPSLSPDGAWLVAGSRLYHLATGSQRVLSEPADALTSVFMPNGDIVAAGAEGGLTRYCRTTDAD